MTWLLIALGVSLAGLSGAALAAAALFVGAAMVHDLLFGALDGFAYYGSAAVFDLLVIIGASRLSEISEFSLQIQKISVLSIFLNLYGYVSWFAYMSPIAYNYAYIALYGWALVLLVIGGGPSVGIYSSGIGNSRLRSTGSAWRRLISELRGSA